MRNLSANGKLITIWNFTRIESLQGRLLKNGKLADFN